MNTEQKVYENLLRRWAHRRGYKINKCRQQDELATGYGKWVIVHKETGRVIAPKFTATSKELEKCLQELWTNPSQLKKYRDEQSGNPAPKQETASA